MRETLVELVDGAIALAGRRRYRRYLADYRAMERWDPERVRALRVARLVELLRWARDEVPYWGETLRPLGAEPEDFRDPARLAELPVTTKDLLREQADRLRPRHDPPGRIQTRSTGGSTGRNLVFRVDIDTLDRRRAAGRLTESWDGVRLGTRSASLWSSPLDTGQSWKGRLFDRLTGSMFLSAWGVGEAELASYAERLERFRPVTLTSYPSVLLAFGRALGRARCRAIGVRVIYLSAEALYEPVRAELEELFGAPVRNRYASREFGLIASDCPSGAGLHVIDPRLWVEWTGNATDDEPGEMLITDLDNRATPFIRYAIEDASVPAEGPCPCGRPWARLARVDGRAFDLVVTPGGRMISGTFFTIAMRVVEDAVRQFQIIQDRPDHLRVVVEPGPAWSDEAWARIEQRLRSRVGTMSIDREVVEEIPRLPSGKRRFVVSEVGRAVAGQAE